MRRIKYLVLAAVLFGAAFFVVTHWPSPYVDTPRQTTEVRPTAPVAPEITVARPEAPAAPETTEVQPAPPTVTPTPGSNGHLLSDDKYPDPQLTPGHVDPNMTEAQVCQPGFAQKNRIVTQAIRQRVFDAYGIPQSERGKEWEIDHFIPVILGGDSPIDGSVLITANLWPQPYWEHPGAHEKDTVEMYLRDQVCKKHTMTLKQAQDAIRGDWWAIYLEWQKLPHRHRTKH
jgi:hypothetical protein